MRPPNRVLTAAARVFVLALLLGAPTALNAQRIRGVVVTGDSTPVAGALVSLVDSLDGVGVADLSDEFGGFELRAPRRGTWRLRTEAVGFARVTSFPFTLTANEVLTRRVQLRDGIGQLQGIEVRDRARCDIRPAEGTQVAMLWGEARKSLAAAVLSAQTAPPIAFDLDDLEYDARLLRVRAASRITTTGRAERGWRSDDPRALRLLGYARRVDTTSIYFAPDARVLLSDDFAATHCFRLVPDDPTSVRRVGIAFAPVGLAEGKLDVAGTLWLDRTTFALDRVEFRYEPLLSADHADSTFGGRVRFSRLPSGHVIVTHWVLRLPIFAEADDGRLARSGQTSAMLVRPERREEVVGVKVARGAARAFDAPPEPLPTVTTPPRRSGGAPSCEGVPAVAGNTGTLLGVVRDARDRAAGGARVRASWHQAVPGGSRIAFPEQWVETGADPQGRFALCALPRGVRISVRARGAGGSTIAPERVVLDAASAPPVMNLELAAPRAAVAAGATGAVQGRIVGSSGRPVPGAEVRIFPGTTTVRSDTAGRFIVPDGPPGQREFFVRRMGFAPTMVMVDVPAGDTAAVVLALTETPQVLAPVTIEATVSSMSLAGFERRRAAGLGGGFFIGPEQIRQRENYSAANLLRTYARVHVEESALTGDARAYGRGGNALMADTTVFDRCAMKLVVDGSPLPLDAPLTWLPPLREIAAIEIYRSLGAIPPQFSYANPECGLVVVWTRSGSDP